MMKFQPTKLMLALLLVVGVTYAGRPFEVSKDKFKKAATNEHYMAIDINNIFNYYINNGDGALNPYTEDDGFEIMNANRGQVLFEEGFVWGGFHKGIIKVGGSSYSHSLQAGPIVTAGTTTTAPVAADASDPKYRVYRVRPDIGPSKTQADVEAQLEEEVSKLSRYEGTTPAQLYALYVKDWTEWPAAQGAPFTDVNNNGVYEPAIDIPGVPGASQTLWYVANDLDETRASAFHRTKPIGIEFQRTIWAYNRTGALGNTIFQKNILINKSGFRVDSMFVAQWADPDVGGSLGYTDDFTGCDTVRSLGFAYNADNNDGFFGSKPPAVGFDFFQGPLVKTNVATDKAIYKGHVLTGYKNLPMTSFNFSVNSSSTYADATENSAAGIQEWYNLLNGLVGRTGAAYTNPVTGKVTKYTLSGDPVTGKGWVDGQIAAPGDRRMSLCSGPFTLAPGDTQEVVVAAIAAQSTNRLASVALLKYYDDLAQSAYDAFFQIAGPPAQPAVAVSELDKKVVLDWSAPATASITESQNELGYKFEGYNVYQLPGNGFTNPKLLATYDLTNGVYTIADQVFSEQYGTTVTVPVQNGNDLGLKRYFVAEKDYINDKSFVNGQKYYFAVTAYNYNPDPKAVPTTIETAAKVLTVIPQSDLPGNRVNADAMQLVNFTAAGAVNDGKVVARVVDPKKVTGDVYTVKIDTTGAVKKWSLLNSAGTTLIANRRVWVDTTDNPIVDGMQWAVLDPGASGGINRVVATQIGTETMNPPVNVLRNPSPDGKWLIDAAGATSRASALSRLNWGNAFGTDDYEVRITAHGSEYYVDGGSTVDNPKAADRIPVEVWDITKNKQLTIKVLDDNGNGKFDTSSIGLSGIMPISYDRIYVTTNPPYVEPLPANSGPSPAAEQPIGRLTFVPYDETEPAFFPPVGTVIRMISNKPILASNVFTVSTAGLQPTISDPQLAKTDITKINVFPNPYFGFNSKEANKYNRFVTFNHLPAKATLNIINLAGVRVRTLLKDDPTQFLNWDLKNESGLPVAAGMYVVYIDMGSIGTKIVKLAIIPEVQQLDKY